MADPVDAAGDAVKPYKIHIPTRHLELTKRKLEFTRLPHEGADTGPKAWWEPKPEVEGLIDFWTEKYQWRDQESVLNTAYSQFRTSLTIPDFGPIRVHFLHIPSPHVSARPLLLLPPFPFTNLSLIHLIQPLVSDPLQPFHLVIPSLPGLGFSDALPAPFTASPIPPTAALFNALMLRLNYPRYIATTTVPGTAVLDTTNIDWRLIRHLATNHSTSCVAANLISPPLSAPDMRSAPWEWTKWTVANFFRAGILGYDDDDFVALERDTGNRWIPDAPLKKEWKAGLGRVGEPGALGYALCDSPVGMLVYVLRALRLLGMTGKLGEENGFWSRERVITMTLLAWLPGPEHVLRLWAGCERWEEERGETATSRPRVGVTVFGVDGPGDGYSCPNWANTEFEVLCTQRVKGGAKKGLLAFERPEVVLEGVRALAKVLVERDPKAFEREGVESGVPLEKIVVVKDESPQVQVSVNAPLKGVPGILATLTEENEEGKGKEKEKEKGKEVMEDGTFPAPPIIPGRDPIVDGESPDTLVEGKSKTPPLDKTT
ncbi:hypothetical protein OQA88_6201 [Cercophora sp. LCS_1]